MSTKIVVQVQMTDDLDGESEAVETVMLGWKGTWYEIDLNAAHLEHLVSEVEPYVKAARRADAPKAPVTGTPIHPGRNMEARRFNAAARKWGKEQGTWSDRQLEAGVALPRKLREEFTAFLVRQQANVANHG